MTTEKTFDVEGYGFAWLEVTRPPARGQLWDYCEELAVVERLRPGESVAVMFRTGAGLIFARVCRVDSGRTPQGIPE